MFAASTTLGIIGHKGPIIVLCLRVALERLEYSGGPVFKHSVEIRVCNDDNHNDRGARPARRRTRIDIGHKALCPMSISCHQLWPFSYLHRSVWLDDFFGNCSALDGCKPSQIEYIAIHLRKLLLRASTCARMMPSCNVKCHSY